MVSNWICDWCNHAQTLSGAAAALQRMHLRVNDGPDGPVGIKSTSVRCCNPECLKLTLQVSVVSEYATSATHNESVGVEPLLVRRLLPQSSAKPQPDYIPAAIREDYVEACLICDLSPKASATLSRRCLQGMIRDYCGVVGKRLIDEIREVERQVRVGEADRSISAESIGAIDVVRKIGNIGAHMESDVDQIVPVDPDEAQLLIHLIESLFHAWYKERHRRKQMFGSLAILAESKRALTAGNKETNRETSSEN